MTYKYLPSSSTWQSDSSVLFAVRKEDIVLDRVDKLLEHYWSTMDYSKRFIFLCDLFFSADYWLKIYKTNPKQMEKKREPAMKALFACAAEQLCKALWCTINGLPRELELMWGRELSGTAVDVDIVFNKAEYLTRAEAAKFRLRFRGGKAYMMPWYRQSSTFQKIELAESRHAFDLEAQAGKTGKVMAPAPNYGFFVLTMSRDLYMAKHRACTKDGQGFYHSSFVAGSPVQCSGTMLIEGERSSGSVSTAAITCPT